MPPDLSRSPRSASILSARRLAPTLVAAALAAAYLLIGPTGADLPAQLARVKLFSAEGFGIWDNWWYGGHNVTAYSVLFPPLAWLTSPQLIAALACVVTAACFEQLAHDAFGDDAWLGATWLGAGTVTELLSGRLTFALGLCGVSATALLISRRRPRWAGGAALLTALASPVAALFAALAGATVLLGGGGRPAARGRAAGGARAGGARRAGGALVIVAALVPVVVLSLLFPEGGSQPFAFSTLWPLLVAGALVAGAGQQAGARAIVVGTLLYLAGCLLAYAIATPVGANAARLGELAAGPLAALLLMPRRAYVLLAVCAAPLAYIQVHDAISDLQKGWQAPYDTAAYYRPLIRFLDSRPGAVRHAWRVEVPFTAGHWEAYRLAGDFALARGWERQLDIADNGLFYGGRLTAGSYHAWLRRLAVRYVVVTDAPADYSARGELALIRGGLPYLHVVRRLTNFTVYAVSDATAVVSGAARFDAMGANWLKLSFTRAGSATVRVRYSPYWELRGVHGCVSDDHGYTSVSANGSGRAELAIGFALGRVGSSSPRCN